MEGGLHENDVGEVETYCVEEDIDHGITYNRCYASDSYDYGPVKAVDEDGLSVKEVEAFKKVVGRDHRTSLFHDLSLTDRAVVHDGMSKLFGPRPYSKWDINPKKLWDL